MEKEHQQPTSKFISKQMSAPANKLKGKKDSIGQSMPSESGVSATKDFIPTFGGAIAIREELYSPGLQNQLRTTNKFSNNYGFFTAGKNGFGLGSPR